MELFRRLHTIPSAKLEKFEIHGSGAITIESRNQEGCCDEAKARKRTKAARRRSPPWSRGGCLNAVNSALTRGPHGDTVSPHKRAALELFRRLHTIPSAKLEKFAYMTAKRLREELKKGKDKIGDQGLREQPKPC